MSQDHGPGTLATAVTELNWITVNQLADVIQKFCMVDITEP
jgi:hypothetical protein